jgi:hypothetical protein
MDKERVVITIGFIAILAIVAICYLKNPKSIPGHWSEDELVKLIDKRIDAKKAENNEQNLKQAYEEPHR